VETAPQPAGRSDDTHSRYIEAVGGLILGCLYPPNGNPVPGPKFDYKLRLFERLTGLAHGSLLTPRWSKGDSNSWSHLLPKRDGGRISRDLA
jgi:hypothetical protein